MTQTLTRKPKRRRAAAIGASILIIAAAGLAWHLTSLRGLPNIGDPFDVTAFSKADVRDEDNAYVLYRQAAAKHAGEPGTLTLDWATARDSEKSWLEQNREALAIWRLGTERPDAFNVPPETLVFDTDLGIIQKLRGFCRLAQLEGSRLEAIGDFRGAWGWYRAILRSSRHCGRRGTLIERLVGIALQTVACHRITRWASRPEVDAALLREALRDVQAIDRMTPPLSDAIKCEYLAFMTSMDRPELVWKLIDDEAVHAKATWQAPKRAWRRFQAFYKREPERSRRALRLMIANLLAYCDLPKSKRPPTVETTKPIFRTTDTAPANARLVPSEQLDDWCQSTIILRSLLPAFNATFNAVDRERSQQAALVVHIATELYIREHGKPPTSSEALVGPYLESLPEPQP